MTISAKEMFKKWWRVYTATNTLVLPLPEELYVAGFAAGCAKSAEARGRCKQCAEKILDGTKPQTGVVKQLWHRVFDAESTSRNAWDEIPRYKSMMAMALQELGKANEALKVYRANPRYEEAQGRTWHYNDREFTGSAFNAIEYFAQQAKADATKEISQNAFTAFWGNL